MDVVKKIREEITSPGFAIEAEMVTKMARMNYRLYSVPITYELRHGESKLSPVRDGFRILAMIVKNLSWHPKG
jgi:dolichol-phosphate mannosyltransferase